MKSKKDTLDKFQEKIGVKFENRDLLRQVFVHRSYLNEHTNFELENNERLEFLGDAVLELVVTEYLYKNYKEQEGELTNWRSALVKGENLAKIALRFEMDKLLLLSRGEEKGNGRCNNLLLANCFEALVGALYLDQEMEVIRKFISKYVLSDLKMIIEKSLHVDPKSHLQELSQARDGVTPEYKVVEEGGPDHAKQFTVLVSRKGEKLAEGKGSSKQEAETSAAAGALKKLK